MCRPTTKNATRLLLTTESFGNDTIPDKKSTFLTMASIVAILFAIEHTIRAVLFAFKDIHPILEDETNQMILARHVGVDFTCCVAVSWIGIANRHHMSDLLDSFFSLGKRTMDGNFENRLFKFIPGGNHVLLMFFAYQVKNTYDTIIWNDGPEYLFHHILAGTAAWGGMYPGCAQYYAIFFMGISEVSTAILVLLANFDPDLGVKGLEDVLPMTRIVVAVAFVLAFIFCRTLLWPCTTYYFCKDVFAALAADSKEAKTHKKWLWTFMVTLTGLSLLQVIWLGQIIILAREEILKLMEEN